MKQTKGNQSIYINDELWEECRLAASKADANVSIIVTKLLRMWLAGQVKVILEPVSEVKE